MCENSPNLVTLPKIYFLNMNAYSSVWMHFMMGWHSVRVLFFVQAEAKTLPKMSSLKNEK
jgi:hypothetical protein